MQQQQLQQQQQQQQPVEVDIHHHQQQHHHQQRKKKRAQSLSDALASTGGGGAAIPPKKPYFRSQSKRVFGTVYLEAEATGEDGAVRTEQVEIAEDDENEDDNDEEQQQLKGAGEELQNLSNSAGDPTNEANNRKKLNPKDETFCTENKLERGTLSAFRREARNILGRELPPHISQHRDNIVKIFTDKGHAKLGPIAKVSLRRIDNTFKYFFQHPYLRLFVCYLVIVCNFLIFAEDPVSHSKQEASIPMVGNVFSFIFTKYPPGWLWRLIKVVMWLLAIVCGLIVGKTMIHGLILSRFLRLKMFRADQGSWMVQFFTVIISLYLFSHAYNILLVLWSPSAKRYTVDSHMYLTSSTVMKCAACGAWLGASITALIVTDMMLQDNLYPSFAPTLRKYWQSHSYLRIVLFWLVSVVMTAVVITVIATDWISWDRLNRDFFATTELSRAFLASFILVMDLTIVMQDWDFPHFTNTLDVNLPGFNRHEISFNFVEIEISGKWFNYGIIFLVMLFDLNMWKNQIFYEPQHYGQYTGVQNKVHTVTNVTVLNSGDPHSWSYNARSQINPETNVPYINEDMSMHSRYLGYSMWIKSMAFIPCIVGFIIFFILIAVYGRMKASDLRRCDREGQAGGKPVDTSASLESPSVAAVAANNKITQV